MFPTSFDEANRVYDKPSDMSYEQCEALSVWAGKNTDGGDVIVSCWKPTAKELEEINKTGRVWCIFYGTGLPPHCLSGQSPFEGE